MFDNCSSLTESLEDAYVDATTTTPGVAAVTAVLFASGLALLVFGARMVRLTSVLLSSALSMAAAFPLLAPLPCTWRVVGTVAVGVVAGGAVFCLFRVGLAVLGATAAGVLVHFVYTALPIPDAGFAVLGQPGAYVLAVACASAAGAILACVFQRAMRRLVACILGATCVTAASIVLADHAGGEPLSPLVRLLLLLGCTALGVAVQTCRCSKCLVSTEGDRPTSKTAPIPLVQGVPVEE